MNIAQRQQDDEEPKGGLQVGRHPKDRLMINEELPLRARFSKISQTCGNLATADNAASSKEG